MPCIIKIINSPKHNTMFDFLFSTWIGGMLLGGYIVGFLFLLHEQNIADNTNVMDTLAEIGVALVWFLPKGYLFIKWILGLFKGKAALFALMVLPVMAMAADNKFLDYQLFPAIGIGIALAPILMLIPIIRKSKGKIPHTWYDENGNKHIDSVKRPVTFYKAFYLYLVVQGACIGICIAILKHASS